MERFDYRGFFTVDGVLTSVGFLPTELNPRLGAGLLRSLHGFEDLPISALQRAIVAGERLDYRPRRLEQALLQATGDHPGGSATLQVEGVPDAAIEVHLGASGDQMTAVEASGDAMVTIRWDVGLRGASVTARLGPAGALGDGSVAPLMAEAFGYARRTWPLTMPHVRPIPEML